MQLTVVVDSVARLREQQLWPWPDLRQFAVAAEDAGADGILLTLQVSHVAARDRDWRELARLSRAKLIVALAPGSASLERLADSGVHGCVLIPSRRHEHSSGGSLAVGLVRDLLTRARRITESHGVEIGARIDPNPEAVRVCADCGLNGVEFNSATFSLATRAESRARRVEALQECVSVARASGLSVSLRGGLSFENVTSLLGIDGICEIRVGQAIIAQALFDGIGASVARMRNLLEG